MTQATGLATSPSYHAKRLTFLLFINGRLVECPPLKRALEEVYAICLPKGGACALRGVNLPCGEPRHRARASGPVNPSPIRGAPVYVSRAHIADRAAIRWPVTLSGHPFVYLSLLLPPASLDVNVHPTKREVHFLEQEQVSLARGEQPCHFLFRSPRSGSTARVCRAGLFGRVARGGGAARLVRRGVHALARGDARRW